MTDHRRRAEELGRYFDWEKDSEQVREIASALKEVEEETWKRAIGCVEKFLKKMSDTTFNKTMNWKNSPLEVTEEEWKSSSFSFDDITNALREEAGKEGVEV